MQQIITPAGSVSGSVLLPGDKSISHRYGMLAAIAEGTSVIENYSSGADCHSTLGAMEALGIRIEKKDRTVTVHGAGLDGLRAPAALLDAGNSGSTIRMLSGILAAQPFSSRIGGDESLSRRPMDRIMKPLGAMGARIAARDGRYPPLEITGGKLHAIDYELPMASAQVKTCVLFGGVFADGATTVREPIRTRDHSELALREFGAEIDIRGKVITLEGRPKLTGRKLTVPGDLSSAAFFIVAALIVPGSTLVIHGVGLNPTRAGLLDVLAAMGAQVQVQQLEQVSGELVGDILIRHAPVKGGVLEGATTAALIDEIPVLAILGAASEEGLTVRDAAELRVKETDRIATVAENLKRMGVEVEVRPDGFHVPGRRKLRAAELDSFGDHRIAMAFSVAALAADGPCVIRDAEAASVSFPEFYNTLQRITA
ncbi:MAG: 3-phosphoshikimate 1-carboxyvinyltransferase [Acidobacteria bacterium]|nr:3-phosphoshikimate 1-carboxyvinyltransferase [Acidobacteriota bacterium]